MSLLLVIIIIIIIIIKIIIIIIIGACRGVNSVVPGVKRYLDR